MENMISFFDPGYLDTMRAGNYKFEQAIAELVDNSLDASAKNIYIFLCEKKNNKIDKMLICDDGIGMDTETLTKAMQTGKKTKVDSSANGKFGQGLKATTIKYSNKCTILTKKEGNSSVGYIEYEELKRNNLQLDSAKKIDKNVQEEFPFVKLINNVDESVLKKDSYTFVFWDEMTDLVQGSLTRNKNSLITCLGQMFRKYIDEGINIYVINSNDKVPVKSIDPLKLNKHFEIVYPKCFSDIIVEDGYYIWKEKFNDKIVELKIRFSQIKEERYVNHLSSNEEHSSYISMLSELQGISFLRGNREIELKKNLGFFKPKNEGSLKYIGCEVIYDSKFDFIFDTDAKKNKISITKQSDIYPVFEKIGKALKEIEKRNSNIASSVKKSIVENNEEKVKFIDFEYDSILSKEENDVFFINEKHKKYKDYEELFMNACKDIEFLKKLVKYLEK